MMKIRLLLLALLSTLLLPGLGVAAQEDACYAHYGLWDAETQTCSLTMGVQVSVNYPLELADFPLAAGTIDSFIKTHQQNFVASYTPIFDLPTFTNNWTLNINYELFQFSDTVRSVLFTLSDYTGGAHPNANFQTFTFDFANDRLLMLADVFVGGQIPWVDISTFVQVDLSEKMGDMADLQWIADGTGENPDNYQNWVLTADSIIFFFPPYQVAAYAAGMQQVEIPFSALHTLLAPPFAS